MSFSIAKIYERIIGGIGNDKAKSIAMQNITTSSEVFNEFLKMMTESIIDD